MALLNSGQKASIAYHNIFDYPLTEAELDKWEAGPLALKIKNQRVKIKKNFDLRREREKSSEEKLLIAKKAAGLITKIPTVRLVAVTGALAMKNATAESDIDLMIITKANSLWLTRLVTLVILMILRIPFRRTSRRDERDKLCLNIWLDETALEWEKKDRNIYTAHEIAQIMPLVNKDDVYGRFLVKNKWILDYWPKAVKLPQDTRILGYKDIRNKKTRNILVSSIEYLAFCLQYVYMKSKITREVVTPHKALFHPNDWGKIVLKQLGLDKTDELLIK